MSLATAILTTTMISTAGIAITESTFPVESGMGQPCMGLARELFGYDITMKDGKYVKVEKVGNGNPRTITMTITRTLKCVARPEGL